MNNRALVIIIIALVILLGGWLVFSSKPEVVPIDENSTTQEDGGAFSPSEGVEPAPTGGRVITIPALVAPVVTYIDTGYTPNILRVARGTTVIFQNGHTIGMWTASDVHPTHGNYPTTGGCLGSTFDSCRGIAPGETWSFTFDVPGTWTYHNHLRSRDRGTIVVE